MSCLSLLLLINWICAKYVLFVGVFKPSMCVCVCVCDFTLRLLILFHSVAHWFASRHFQRNQQIIDENFNTQQQQKSHEERKKRKKSSHNNRETSHIRKRLRVETRRSYGCCCDEYTIKAVFGIRFTVSVQYCEWTTNDNLSLPFIEREASRTSDCAPLSRRDLNIVSQLSFRILPERKSTRVTVFFSCRLWFVCYLFLRFIYFSFDRE